MPEKPSNIKLITKAYLLVCIPCTLIAIILWYLLWMVFGINYIACVFIGLLGSWYYWADSIRKWITWANANGAKRDRIIKAGRLSLILWSSSTVDKALTSKKESAYKPLLLATISMILVVGIISVFKGPAFILTKYYYYCGYSLQKAKNMQGAINYYSKVLNYDRSYTTAYISRGSAYVDLKKYDSAISDYNQAIKLAPNDAQPYAYRGRAYYELKDTAKALEDYTKAINIDQGFAYAYYNRGFLKYTLLKDMKGGCADLQKALDLGMTEAKDLMERGGCN